MDNSKMSRAWKSIKRIFYIRDPNEDLMKLKRLRMENQKLKKHIEDMEADMITSAKILDDFIAAAKKQLEENFTSQDLPFYGLAR